ncbi:hypothetical protein BC830DRAFT_504637 [Chytriomyces sp. MP71]|nr:hypothetical protein BC830DRAFT_504637 [Chytriomyces sp. MP71]
MSTPRSATGGDEAPSDVQVNQGTHMSFQIYTTFGRMSHEASSPSLSDVSPCARSCFSISSNASNTVFIGPGSVNLLLESAIHSSPPMTPQSPSPRLTSRATTTSVDSHLEGTRRSMSPIPKSSFKPSSKFNCSLKLTRKFACTECPLFFHRNHDLRRHIRSVHGIGKKVFICKVCNIKEFGRADSVARHEKTCKGSRFPTK